jgi:hypothetical protein
LHEPAKLVPGVGKSNRRSALGDRIAGKELSSLGRIEQTCVEPEQLG